MLVWYCLFVLAIACMVTGATGGKVLEFIMIYVLLFFGIPAVVVLGGLYVFFVIVGDKPAPLPPRSKARSSDYGQAFD